MKIRGMKTTIASYIIVENRFRIENAFSELKEEENERLHSRKELTSTRMTFREQSAWSHNMKRMKLDLNLQSTSVFGATTEHYYHKHQLLTGHYFHTSIGC
ncbi:Uncharacterized protein Fot_18903 [Forsythia ovata]|uniref:Transposase IS4-like domain-containing protein n=1 Tax=Forsythia ovata TaxID=205694 RepID=A0ABD1VJJ9_9LAMI